MNKTLLFTLPFLSVLFLSTFASAMPYKPDVFCRRQGHQVKENRVCYFGNNQSCDLKRFYNGSCGQEFRQELPCRQQGESVYSQFESCCSGLKAAQPTSNWPFGGLVVMGPKKCYPQHEVFLHNHFWSLVVTCLISVGAIATLFWKQR